MRWLHNMWICIVILWETIQRIKMQWWMIDAESFDTVCHAWTIILNNLFIDQLIDKDSLSSHFISIIHYHHFTLNSYVHWDFFPKSLHRISHWSHISDQAWCDTLSWRCLHQHWQLMLSHSAMTISMISLGILSKAVHSLRQLAHRSHSQMLLWTQFPQAVTLALVIMIMDTSLRSRLSKFKCMAFSIVLYSLVSMVSDNIWPRINQYISIVYLSINQ